MRRVFALSDLHIDYAVNAQWLAALSEADFTNDVLILAGDISDSPKLLAFCFKELARRFHRVLYVPGNHDLWVLRFDTDLDSLQKWELVQGLARAFGILLEPWHDMGLSGGLTGGVSIVPLLSWYDFSFGLPDAALQEAWMDFYACKWPADWQAPQISQHFLQANQPVLQQVQTVLQQNLLQQNPLQQNPSPQTLITFSHFMPRIDLMPDNVPLARRNIYPVLGAQALDLQIRQLQPALHVYGHSHLNRRVMKDGILYINNAFGYPLEKRIAARQLLCVHEY